ncbi:hypothetical protein L1887_38391 [Cichorium endivia]|nr:hypothetical protein L1887_38391 [Cichorium endivia]
MEFFDKLKIWVLLICLISQSGHGFYHPGSHPPKYVVGEPLSVKVSSLTSIATIIPYNYYTLPFCKPPEGVKDIPDNLGELLMGDWIQNSPYKFKMYTNETEIFLCQTKSLTSDEYNLLTTRIEEIYQVNLLFDDMPAIRYVHDYPSWTGYQIGIKISNSYYVFNHLKFTVSVQKYEEMNVPGYIVVGFEVNPCSVKHNPKSLKNLKSYSKYPSTISCDDNTVNMAIKENEPIAFTYEVTFIESDIKWPSRWNAYMKTEGAKVHWFSIVNSLIVVTFMAGIILVIFLKRVKRDLNHHEDTQSQMNEEYSNSKLVVLVPDVLRAPNNPALFCVMVGTGVQIIGTAVVTIAFSALGFTSPASRSALVTGMLISYIFLGILAGYIAVRMWRTIFSGDHNNWISISWKVACFFPGIAFFILSLLNFLLRDSHSTRAIPFPLLVTLILRWFCISLPLTFAGGYFATKTSYTEYTITPNQIAREIPSKKYPSWLSILFAGTLPFGTLFMEINFIMSSIAMGSMYYNLGFLFVVLILFLVICAEVSVLLTYMHLCVDDWKWCWKSFFASGSVALYIFLYSMYFLVFDLMSLSGPVSATLYVGYSILVAIAVMLVTGTVGFFSSFWFVHYLFLYTKLD